MLTAHLKQLEKQEIELHKLIYEKKIALIQLRPSVREKIIASSILANKDPEKAHEHKSLADSHMLALKKTESWGKTSPKMLTNSDTRYAF